MDITIRDFMAIKSINKNFTNSLDITRELVNHFNLNNEDLDITNKKLSDIITDMNNIDFKKVIEFNGKKFGFIENFNKIKTNEFLDLMLYETDENNIHRMMSVMYRPIKRRFSLFNKELYQIEKYNGTHEDFLDLPYKYYLGCIVFFLNIKKELLRNLQIYFQKHPQKMKEIVQLLESNSDKSGDGISI